jgi:hypothetical protein
MNAMNRTPLPRVTALGIAIRGLPGPALMGRTSANVALNVDSEGGAAVTGLHREAFSFALVRFAATSSAGMTPLVVASFGEPMPGICAIELRHTNGVSLDAGSHAIVVSVGSTGDDKSMIRTMLRLDV